MSYYIDNSQFALQYLKWNGQANHNQDCQSRGGIWRICKR